MVRIKISKPTEEQVRKLNIKAWASWNCDPSEFDWEYATDETAYVFKGKVVITSKEGETIEIGPGDLVTFPKGLKCRWNVIERIEKVYTMR